MSYFAVTTDIDNINKKSYIDKVNGSLSVNDIIKYKVGGNWVFSIIDSFTDTTIKVKNLTVETTDDYYYFYINNTVNRVTNNSLVFRDNRASRCIYKLNYVTYVI